MWRERIACGCLFLLAACGSTSANEAAGDAGDAGSAQDGPGIGMGGPQSCGTPGAGVTQCGAQGADDCCSSLSIPAGTFARDYSNVDGGTQASSPATLSAYRLDKYEVTVGRFRAYVRFRQGGGMPPAAGSGKHGYLNGGAGVANAAMMGTFEAGWNQAWNGNLAPDGWDTDLSCNGGYATWTSSPGANEARPINCVNWYEAYAFCIWDGGFLPTEAEWEYAWAAGNQQREYPWGSTDPGTSNLYAIFGCYYPSGMQHCTGDVNIAPVGSAPSGAGLWGQLDLAGNVWEWNLDWEPSAYAQPCNDCAYLPTTGPTNRLAAGGAFVTPLEVDGARGGNEPSVRSSAFGFRCARAP